MSAELIVFIVLAIVAIGAAVSMLLSHNAVYSALFLVVNFATVAVLYLMLGAPFIAVAQITIYAGAIMVLFLFVIMLLGSNERLNLHEPLRGQRLMGLIAALVLLVEFGLLFVVRSGMDQVVPVPTIDSSPAAIGMELFGKYALPFEITSVILLVAAIGAVVLTRTDTIHRIVRRSVNTKEEGSDKKS